MVGIGAYALAGAAEGMGVGMVNEARAKRQAAIEDLKHKRLVEREEADRSFRREENEKSRVVTRQGQRKEITGSDGNLYSVDGQEAKLIKTPDGQAFKGVSTKGQKPADVKTAEWLVQQGIARDSREAWKLVRSARANPEATRVGLIKAFISAGKNPFGKTDMEEVRKQAEEQADAVMKSIENGAPNVDAAMKARPIPKGMTPDQVLEEARSAIEAGKDAELIKKRLREFGINPDLL